MPQAYFSHLRAHRLDRAARLKIKAAEPVHEWSGYAVLFVVRAAGPLGMDPAALCPIRRFLAGPSRVVAYARAVLRDKEPRCVGHNPLGGWIQDLRQHENLAAAMLSGVKRPPGPGDVT